MPEQWSLHISRAVAQFIYTLPRGQATALRDALAVLRTNPKPDEARLLAIEDLPDMYEVTIGLYRIEYQIIDSTRTIRVLFVE